MRRASAVRRAFFVSDRGKKNASAHHRSSVVQHQRLSRRGRALRLVKAQRHAVVFRGFHSAGRRRCAAAHLYAVALPRQDGSAVRACGVCQYYAGKKFIAAAGKLVTPGGAVEICHILGREETIRRVKAGIAKLA